MIHVEPSVDIPIPPGLAVEEEPIPPDLLERWTNYVIETASEAGLDPEAIAGTLTTDETYVPEVIRRFEVDGDRTAEWAMRHLAAIWDERAALEAQAAEWSHRIAEWFAQRDRPLGTREAFFRGHLERYALAVREASGDKTKSVVLPSGRISTTATKPKVAVEDEAALLAWVKENLEDDEVGRVVKTTEKVLVSELRDSVVLVELPSNVILSPCGHTGRPPVDFVDVCEVAAWTVGSVVACPGCGEEAMVGQWIETYLAVRDEAGRPVPGANVAPGTTTARVQP